MNDFIKAVGGWIKEHSGQIAAGVAVVAGVAGTAFAIKETYDHLDDIVCDHNDRVDTINKDCKDEEKKGKLVKAYAETGKELVKVYWPTLLLETLSIGSIIFCYKSMDKKYKDLSVAYGTLATAFATYKSRVKELYGDDAHAKIVHKTKEIITEDGEQITEPDIYDDSTVIWSFETAPNTFKKDVYANRLFLMSQEKYINHLLRTHQFVTLNEIYKLIGLPETVSGCQRIKIFDNNSENRDNQFVFRLIRDDRYLSWSEYLDGSIPEVLIEIECDQSLMDLKRSGRVLLK